MAELPPQDPAFSVALQTAHSGNVVEAINQLAARRNRNDLQAIRFTGLLASNWGAENEDTRVELVQKAFDSGAWYLRNRLFDIYSSQPEALPKREGALLELVSTPPLANEPMQIVFSLLGPGQFDLAARFFAYIDGLPSPNNESNISESYSALISKMSELEGAVTVAAEGAKTTIDDAAKQIELGQQELLEDTDEAKKLAQQLVSTGLAEEYDRHASRDGRSAMIFAGLALVVGAFAAYVAIKFGGDYIEKTKSPSAIDVFARTGLAIPFIAVAGYLAALSGSFRRMSWHWRHIALQLRAFRPFIQRLNRDEQRQITAIMTPRFFPGQSLDPQGDGTSEPSHPSIGSTLGTFGTSQVDESAVDLDSALNTPTLPQNTLP